MNHRLQAKLGSAASAALLFAMLATKSDRAGAIEGPEPQSSPEALQDKSQPAVEPGDQNSFYAVLQRSTQARVLHGLNVPDSVIEALSGAAAADAVAALSERALHGDLDSNIALVRVQHWCNRVVSSRPQDAQTRIAQLNQALSEERAAKAAGVIQAEASFIGRAREACMNARFDYSGIEARLREAAESGHPASAVELAQFVRDPAKREALVKSAADKNYAPALYATATNLLMAVQRGETTQNVGSIRLLLKQAGRTMPKAKLDLANCMALGCDGHPADALTARAFGTDAARDGELTAFPSMVRMPWGGRLSRTERLAWQYFGDRLNEAGCFGEAYIATAVQFVQTIAVLEKEQTPQALETARTQAEELWRENGPRAMREQGCGINKVTGGASP